MTTARTIAGACALACAALAMPAMAQGYPTKPIRFVIPYAAGGGTDLTARPIAVKLTERLGKAVLLDNRPGASGMIGADVVAKAAPDGYTVLVSAASEMSMNVMLFKKMPYDPLADFQAVTLATTTPAILVTHPSMPAKSLKELIALAKRSPSGLSYASVGIGSPMHFAGELMNSMVKTQIVHVAYKGAAPALTDLLGGHIPMGFVTLLAASPHVTSGKLRAIGVTSGKRAAGMPQVPTLAESGLPGFDITQWFAVWVPANTPKDIVAKLNTEITAIVRSAEYKQRMLESGTEAVGGPAEELRVFQRNEIAKYRKIATTAGIQPE